MGRGHLPPGSEIEYGFCPPTSGQHYLVGPQVPIRAGYYGPDTQVRPGTWVHNLEHGYVVIAYRGGAGGPTPDELSQLEAFADDAPASAYAESCPDNKVVVVRFDDMATRFAHLAWDRALVTDTFDPAQATQFYQQWVDSPQSPERGAC